MKKVVLAFSGGLDTSFCAVYLQQDLGYEVHAVTVNTGGFNADEVEKLREKTMLLGAKTFTSLDVVKEYYDSCIQYLVFGNVLKNNTYPLSVSAERTIQAKSLAEFALKIGATAIAHGSTGAGNDQVRFDGIFNIVCPEMEIITPIRDLKLSREAEIEYLTEKGFSGYYTKSTQKQLITQPLKALYSLADLASLTGLCPKTVSKMLKDNGIEPIKIKGNLS